MHELTGRLMNVSFSYDTGKPIVAFEVNEKAAFMQMVDCVRDAEKLKLNIDIYREKRSLNANNYAWKLITEIANAARMSKDDVYLVMLRRYGQSEMISVLEHIPIRRYVKYCEEVGESVLQGKKFKHYRVYKGSSEFDTREMSIFLDGIIGDAKDLGIQTETPEKIANLKSMWGE